MSNPRLIPKKEERTTLNMSKSVPITITNSPPEDTNNNSLGKSPPKLQASLYKTERCRSWIATGNCKYGNKCQFAHGEDELRPVVRHPKYKTQICKTYSREGICPYGTRCRFIHPGAEQAVDPKSSLYQNDSMEFLGTSAPSPSASPIFSHLSPSPLTSRSNPFNHFNGNISNKNMSNGINIPHNSSSNQNGKDKFSSSSRLMSNSLSYSYGEENNWLGDNNQQKNPFWFSDSVDSLSPKNPRNSSFGVFQTTPENTFNRSFDELEDTQFGFSSPSPTSDFFFSSQIKNNQNGFINSSNVKTQSGFVVENKVIDDKKRTRSIPNIFVPETNIQINDNNTTSNFGFGTSVPTTSTLLYEKGNTNNNTNSTSADSKASRLPFFASLAN